MRNFKGIIMSEYTSQLTILRKFCILFHRIYRKGADFTCMSVCVSKIMLKVLKYTCRLRHYDYTISVY